MNQTPKTESNINLEVGYLKDAAHGTSAERAAAFRNLFLLRGGYLASDELIGLSLQNGFELADPFTRVRRGTSIGSDAKILEGTVIDGRDVTIGRGAILNRAVIQGSRVSIGDGTSVSGLIEIDRICIGTHNEISNIKGFNRGEVILGDKNRIGDLFISNESPEQIVIGSENRFYDGLHLNIPFEQGRIWIGNLNELGRDGGGVISCSYRFGNRWWGHVVIGTGVETTRGAEVLGFSLLGWPLEILQRVTGFDEEGLAKLFTLGNLEAVSSLLERLCHETPARLLDEAPRIQTTSLFGVVKVKRCCLVDRVRIKDNTRVQAAYLKEVDLQERCVVLRSALVPAEKTRFDIPFQDLAFANVIVREEPPWQKFFGKAPSDEYSSSDALFFEPRR